MRAFRLALLLVLAMAASGGAEDAGSARPERTTRLVIEIREDPEAEPTVYTLHCDPPRGTVPDPVRACRRIATLMREAGGDAGTEAPPSRPRPSRPSPPSSILCPPVHGGRVVATVRGLLHGYPVDDRYTREGGCAMTAYDRMMWLLGVPEGPEPGALGRVEHRSGRHARVDVPGGRQTVR